MGVDFCVAPNNANTVTAPPYVFMYGINWGDGVAWSDGAILRLVSDDGTRQQDFQKGDGQAAGDLLVFTFPSAQPGIQYRGKIVDGDYEISHFGLADLCAVQHPADACCHLPFADPPADPADAAADESNSQGGDDSADDAAASSTASPSSDDDSDDSSDADGADYDADAVAAATAPGSSISTDVSFA